MDDNRTLTDADVQALAAEIEKGITRQFQINVGKGVLGLAWKMMVWALIALAAYGAGGGFKKFF